MEVSHDMGSSRDRLVRRAGVASVDLLENGKALSISTGSQYINSSPSESLLNDSLWGCIKEI